MATIIGSSLTFIDSTVVNVALPALQTDLHATITDIQWVIEAYALFLVAVPVALAAWRQKWKPARAFAVTAALFLLLAPGFGPQYLIYPLAPLLLADALAGAVWAAFAGGFACALYGTGCAGIWPYSTWLPTPMLEVVRNCGVAAWAALASSSPSVGFAIGITTPVSPSAR